MAVARGPGYGPGGQQSGMLGLSMGAWGYMRKSKQQQDGQVGMDLETQELALVSDSVPVEHVFRDVAISGTVATMSQRRDVVVELARVGGHWTCVINSVRQLREQGIRLRSLAAAEQVWTR